MYVHKTNLFTQILWRRIKQMTILTKQYWALISKIHCLMFQNRIQSNQYTIKGNKFLQLYVI